MEILLVVPKYNLTTKKNYDHMFPLGLSYISATMKNAGYSVTCLNLNNCEGTIANLINSELSKKKYDIVCTGGNALMYSVIQMIISTALNHSSKPCVILGGIIITSEPSLMMNSLKPHFGVISEGEVTILELLKTIENKGDFSKIDGIAYKNKDGKLVFTKPRAPIKDIETIALPDYDGMGYNEWLDNIFCNTSFLNHIFDYPRTYFILGSRGCPFNCSFCWHDVKYRSRSVKDIMKELNVNVKKYRINNIVFLDECFSINPDRVYEVCKGINDLSKQVPWTIRWSSQFMVSSAKRELLDTMKKNGCFTMSYGFESYSPVVLKSMRKPITPELIKNALDNTLGAGIAIVAHFILGDIAETKETARETINFWKNHCNGQVGIGFIQPYPGSTLYNYCIQNGIIKDKLNYIKNEMGPNNYIKMTPHLTNNEFNELRSEVLDTFGKGFRFIRPISLKKMNTKKKTYAVTVRCPFCKEVLTYQNCYIPNTFTFGFYLICRKCPMRFFVVSFLQKMAYQNYSKVRVLRTYYLRLRTTFRRILVS